MKKWPQLNVKTPFQWKLITFYHISFQILPETMESFLNEHCMASTGNVTNENFKISLKFDFLIPPHDQELFKVFYFYSRLSWLSAARGCDMSFSRVGPIKV